MVIPHIGGMGMSSKVIAVVVVVLALIGGLWFALGQNLGTMEMASESASPEMAPPPMPVLTPRMQRRLPPVTCKKFPILLPISS